MAGVMITVMDDYGIKMELWTGCIEGADDLKRALRDNGFSYAQKSCAVPPKRDAVMAAHVHRFLDTLAGAQRVSTGVINMVREKP